MLVRLVYLGKAVKQCTRGRFLYFRFNFPSVPTHVNVSSQPSKLRLIFGFDPLPTKYIREGGSYSKRQFFKSC
ncbi:hypothetical protein PM082_008864 [Marasmius tenuissimus]|nr:hypothetical protein PM082_008864 [Marasmius tenuissimus]